MAIEAACDDQSPHLDVSAGILFLGRDYMAKVFMVVSIMLPALRPLLNCPVGV